MTIRLPQSCDRVTIISITMQFQNHAIARGVFPKTDIYSRNSVLGLALLMQLGNIS
ncbi:MAG: hypothetical protein F6J86_26365 [Symploca sp. SIO1B1]|nr:hypothetical protein [Symploca sp. SIO1B1]